MPSCVGIKSKSLPSHRIVLMAVPRKGNQGKPRSRWLAPLGGGDQRVEWRKPLDCPDWMDAAQFAQLPDSLQARA
jgi:hypothetical protein